MAGKRQTVSAPHYGTVRAAGSEYYRTRIEDADGRRVALYGRTCEELHSRMLQAQSEIESHVFRRGSPTVKEYCEKWLLMQSVQIRTTTLTDYHSKVKNYIIKPLGHKRMADVTPDDIRLALVPVSRKSVSVYKSVNILYKSIFNSAMESRIISENPASCLSSKAGGVPQKDKIPLTDAQATILLDAIRGLPPYTFVMLGLYAGLRREEILALKWDCVFLDEQTPYLSVRRAWHTEKDQPVISTELKTPAARRDIPIPPCLVECLRAEKSSSISDYVVANSKGGPLTKSQFFKKWQYIKVRSTQERHYCRYVNGQIIHCNIQPRLGEHAPNNPKLVYSIDFHVSPHQLRHTYITNLIYASVDPKTVQYLAGHENSRMTMDVYAKVKYNKPQQLYSVINQAIGKA